ncbi:hypothetical protein HC928_24525 [bacterium]|nr:hypothetical protein [bacterium]
MQRRILGGVAALAVLGGLFAYAPGGVYAACSTAGTAGDDVIVCDGTTPSKVFGLDGNDVITNNGTISSGGIDGAAVTIPSPTTASSVPAWMAAPAAM